MSLSHPDSVVTEQRLSEFYQGILPYLGGNDGIHRSFPVVVDEGGGEYQAGWYYNSQGLKKPLYQKTWEFSTPLICGAATWTDTTVSNSGISKLIGVEVIDASGTSCWDGFGVTTDSANNVIRLYNTRTTSGLEIKYMTLKYTKTTDTYISPDVEYPVKYSTSEQVIGQWIDGKPIYQKTIDCGALPNNTSKEFDHNISNIDIIVSVKGESWNSDKSGFFVLPTSHPTANANINLNANRTKIFLVTAADRSSFVNTYVTLQYTKTTD